MSETYSDLNPYDPGTADYDAYVASQRAIGKGIVTSLSAAPAALASLVVPDPKTNLPATGLVGQAGQFADLLVKGLGAHNPNATVDALHPSDVSQGDMNEFLTGKPTPAGVVPTTTNFPNLPFHQEIDAAVDRTRARGRELLPPMPATNAGERIGQSAVEAAASMGVPLPAKLMTSLPTAAKAVVGILNPATTHAASAFGFGGAVGAADGAGAELDKSNGGVPGPAATPSPASITTDNTIPPPPTPPVDNSGPLPVPPVPPPVGPPPPDPAVIEMAEGSNWKWADFAAGLATVGGIIAGHKFLNAKIGSQVEATRRAAYEGNTAYADHQQAQVNGIIGAGTPAPEVPLPPRNASPLIPEAVSQTSLKARTAFVDENATINSVNDFHAPNTDTAQLLRGQWGTSGNRQFVGERVKQIADTGHDSKTGVSMPSLRDQAERIATWEDPQRQLYNDARYAADELDNRTRLFNQQPAGTNKEPVQFSNFTDQQLRDQVARGYADPDVAFELYASTTRTNAMIDMLERSGMLTGQAAQDLKSAHPNYLPTSDAAGLIDNPLQARDLTQHSGMDAPYVPAWELDKQHFETLIGLRERNLVVGNTLENILANQTRNPNLPKLVEESRAPAPPGSNSGVGPFIQKQDGTTVGYRVNGELKWVKVNNSGLRLMLQQPPATQGAFVKMASQVAAIARSGTTQAIAAMAGSPFSVKNALRMTTRMGIAHSPETYTGYLDRLAQQATGGRVGVPGGLDPTMWMAPVIGTSQNVYAMAAHAAADMLRPEASNWFNQFFRSNFGHAWTNAASDRIQLAYRRSIRGQMQEAGALNSTGLASVEVPTSQLSAAIDKPSVLNATVPELYMDKGPFAAPKVVRLNNLFHEILNSVGESVHTFYYGLNRTNPELVRKYGYEGAQRMNVFNTRQLGGDVGQRGSNQLFREYAGMSKYTNVTVQDWANLTDAMAARPFQTGLNYATTVGLPALASVYTAILAGPLAMQHLFGELSNDQRSANFHFYIPGQEPENTPSWPLSQTDRFGATLFVQLMADIGNLKAHGTNDPTFQWMKQGLEDVFSKHISENALEGAKKGFASAVEAPVPDLLQTGIAAASGKRLSVNPVDLLDPTNNQPIDQRLLKPLGGSEPGLPGGASDRDANAGAVTGSMFWNALSAALGVTGSALHQSYLAGRQNYTLNHDPMEALGAVGDTFQDRFKQSVPIARGVLWNAPEKLSTRSPLADSVYNAVEKLKPTLTAKGDEKNFGLTRAKGMEVSIPGQEEKGPTDPVMKMLYQNMQTYASQLLSKQNAPMKEVGDYQKLIAALPYSGKPQKQITQEHNELVRVMQLSLARAATIVEDANTELSASVGKHVDVRKIDWTKGVEQFQ